MTIQGFSSRTTRLFLVALLVMSSSVVVDRASAQGEKTAAIVNGEIITEGEFFERLQHLRAQSFVLSATQLKKESAGFILMEAMINERLTLQTANKANIALSETETATELANLKKQPSVLEGLAKHEYTEEMLKQDIRISGARFKLATAGVKATPEDVEKFYKAHIADYTIPEQWGISIIRTGNLDTLAKIDADLKANKSFADTAKLYSEDLSSRDKGGDSGVIVATDTRIPAPIRDAVKLLKPGEVSPTVKTELDAGPGKSKVVTWWRLLLRTREPESVRPLSDIRAAVERFATIEKADAPGNYSATSVSSRFVLNATGLASATDAALYALSGSTSTASTLATFASSWMAASGVTAVTSDGVLVAGYYGNAMSDGKNHLLAVPPSTYLGPLANGSSFALLGNLEVYSGFDVLNAVGFKDGVAVQLGWFLPPTYEAVTSSIVRYPLTLSGSGPQTVVAGTAQTVIFAPNRCTNVEFIGHLGVDLLMAVRDRNGRRLVRLVKP